MLQLQEVYNIIQLLKNIAESKKENINIDIIREISDITHEVNRILYHSELLKFQRNYDNFNANNIEMWINELKRLISCYEQTLLYRNMQKTDVVFWQIYEYFQYVDKDEILNETISKVKSLPQDIKDSYKSLEERYEFLNAGINCDINDFSLIEQHIDMMVNHIEDYKWLYQNLQDYRSKAVLNGIISYWFTFDINKMHNLCETIFCDYYDMDILKCDKDEVLVDLGAYTGDSIYEFINTYGNYKNIYAYEITPMTFNELEKNLCIFPNIDFRQKGAGDKDGVMFLSSDKKSAGNKLVADGNVRIEVVSLDEDIKEPITIIKMDIEGAEKAALRGAYHHIKNEKPRLLISSYHMPEDIFEIPKLIHSIRDDYKFYMRFNGHNGLWPCDYVLFAI